MAAVNAVKRVIGIRRASPKYVWFNESGGMLMSATEVVVEYPDGRWGIEYVTVGGFAKSEWALLDEARVAAFFPKRLPSFDSKDDRMEAAILAHQGGWVSDERWWIRYRATKAAEAANLAVAEQERRAQEQVAERERMRDKELHRCERCGGDTRQCSTLCCDDCNELDCRYVWMAYGWRIKHGLLNVVPNEACDALAVMLREAEEKADG